MILQRFCSNLRACTAAPEGLLPSAARHRPDRGTSETKDFTAPGPAMFVGCAPGQESVTEVTEGVETAQ